MMSEDFSRNPLLERASRMAPHDAAVFIGYFVKIDRLKEKIIDVMRRSHPGVEYDDLISAIDRAEKLWSNCLKYCAETYETDTDYGTVDRAIERTRVDNPGFSDESYGHVSMYYEIALR